ncbi:hypothetical protein GCM10011367_24920 [Marinicauda pacifica]|jgi:uncharacterized protein YcfJ|uniref:YMGG-like Gly-zipper domain-containing protein n=1 Tax=Marinicauda pacifica TaxID=1133559 RepID=A0A4S2H9C8_9PROT|nr:YMGG-like glycine zipper-containing protein [Marinicauda pacifica]TGY92460.1 hypothetical protein E5162_12540 [Marinicauda pacifica]GGE49114.1 hypothetical protein GCM10011367_24920 [Marinicauda pacifica]
MRILTMTAVAVTALVTAAACQTSQGTQRGAMQGALGGAAVGAAAGAISGDVGVAEGAAIGAATGAAAGAYVGCSRDNACPWSRSNDQHSELVYDQRYDRYYYENYRTGCTYWRDGTVRYCDR